jgi:hypothetical protein
MIRIVSVRLGFSFRSFTDAFAQLLGGMPTFKDSNSTLPTIAFECRFLQFPTGCRRGLKCGRQKSTHEL